MRRITSLKVYSNLKRHGSGSVSLFFKWKIFSLFFALKISLETLSTVEMEDMDTEENSPPDQYAVLKQQLEVLVKESQVQPS